MDLYLACPECGVVFQLVHDRVDRSARAPEQLICPVCDGVMILVKDDKLIPQIRRAVGMRREADNIVASTRLVTHEQNMCGGVE